MAQKYKKDDIVQVLAGKDKGKTGKILLVNAQTEKIIVEGINLAKFHKKKSEKSEGGIIELPRPIHRSNLMLVCPEKKTPVKVGFKQIDKIKKRISKSTGSTF
jgi:large subunit ribosomal protein L24